MFIPKIESMRRAIEQSRYTVALCGSGILEECGYIVLKKPDRAYEIEAKYGVSPEYIFTDSYYNTRTDKFFEFYRNEVLKDIAPPDTSYKLAAMERAGRLNCIITSNLYELSQRAGCHNVINMHGSIYQNRCNHCGREYSVDYIKNSKRVPLCESCGSVIRPKVAFFGDMLDGRLIARAAGEVERADVLLVLGTTLDSDVFGNYIKYFNGSKMIIVHKEEHLKDKLADIVIYDTPGNVLAQLGY